jgi:hypothetical protein
MAQDQSILSGLSTSKSKLAFRPPPTSHYKAFNPTNRNIVADTLPSNTELSSTTTPKYKVRIQSYPEYTLEAKGDMEISEAN